jgi:hypothetical protein
LKKIFVTLALVILIISSISLLSFPHVKADTSEAQILSYSWYVSTSSNTFAQYIGDLIVVGEIQNVGTKTLGNVIIGGEAYNSTGNFLSSAEFGVFATNLGPGQKAPFYLEFNPVITDITTFDQNWAYSATNVTVRVINVVDSSQTQYSGLTIPSGSVSASAASGTYTLTGTVQNTGDQKTGHVWVVSTFYNSSGTVVGLNYTNYITQSLLPGRSAAFTATPVDNTAQLTSSIASYSILIQSDSAPTSTPTPTAPITTSTPQSTTSPTSSSQSTATPPIEVTAWLIVYLAAIVAAIILVIIAVLLLLSRRHRNAELDLPPPPPEE